MFAARQSFGVFQKRAFSASARQVCMLFSFEYYVIRAPSIDLLFNHDRLPRSPSLELPAVSVSLCLCWWSSTPAFPSLLCTISAEVLVGYPILIVPTSNMLRAFKLILLFRCCCWSQPHQHKQHCYRLWTYSLRLEGCSLWIWDCPHSCRCSSQAWHDSWWYIWYLRSLI